MDNRPEPEEVTARLTTTAAKIRALAKAGYYQAEIGKLLNIRYQNVRKVLIDAGRPGCLRPLARGTDRFNHFDHEAPPQAELDDAALAVHADSQSRYWKAASGIAEMRQIH